tara:strand:+ start:9719 stop:10387 length:669 start_codon:yes stop_codon:yes gene_type:complete
MGYLDNSTIVVDAVLTKQGRKLLALGQGLNISYFTLSDTGVDYSLWNPDHPSGSAYYGEAIENMPNLEALPNSAYFMRNNLLTLSRDVKAMPYVTLQGKGIGQAASYVWGTGNTDTVIIPINLENVASEDVGWQIVVPDSSLVTVSGAGWSQASIGGNVQQYLNDQEISNAVIYEAGAGVSTVDIDRVNTTTTRTLLLTFVSKSTGAYKHFSLTMPRYPIDQ